MAIVNLNPAELKAALDAGNVALIDVREPQEWAQGYIEGAQSLPLSVFDPAALPDDGREIIFYCAAGVRSARAIEYLQHQGFEVSKHLSGGTYGWVAAGYPLTVD